MIKTKKQMFIVIGISALVFMLFTTTYAFFNYTRTGAENLIQTGRISFSSNQGPSINLTNIFPVDVSNGIPNNDPNVGSVTINITGDTEYTGGIEYLVTAVNVQNTVGTKQLPISIDVSVGSNTGNNPITTLGTVSEDYFTLRGDDTSYYKVLASDVIENNEQLVVGYIAPGQDGVDGNIMIKAYIDADKIAISDTYYENAPTPAPTAPNDQYGTTTEWVDGRTVLTTTEWNSLQTNGVSFQIKVEAQEDTWVDDPNAPPTMAQMCPGCVFVWINNNDEVTSFTYGENGDTFSDLLDGIDSSNYVYSSNYEDVVTDERNYFMGLVLENGTSGRITRVFACGIKIETQNTGNPFCLEGTHDGSAYNRNLELMTSSYLWNDPNFENDCDLHNGYPRCYQRVNGQRPALNAGVTEDGGVFVADSNWASVRVGMWGEEAVFDPYGS